MGRNKIKLLVAVALAAVVMAAGVLVVSTTLGGRLFSFDAQMKWLAAEAATRAKTELGIGLDYTPGSVKDVETILAGIHDRNKSSPLSRRTLHREARLWGAYFGEVIKPIHGRAR